MQDIIIEEPYEFVPPVESDLWCWLLRFYLHRFMRKNFAVHSFECRGIEKLRKSIDQGDGIILAANHSRLADPTAMGELAGKAGTEIFAMASWHLFKEGWYQRYMIRRMGAFSVYREGNDRASVNYAIDILTQARRPLLIFPEGAVSRHNDLLMDLMEGPGFIARQATKKREKAGKAPVVIHPIAIRYSFDGDPEKAIGPELEELEKSLSWQPQSHLTTRDRLRKLGVALLGLKEMEYLGESFEGNPHERAENLIRTVLINLETKWGISKSDKGTDDKSVVSRVKKIRTVVLPDIIEKNVTPEERENRWRDLAACYYLQQIAHYPEGYLTGKNDLPERVLETFERMKEDFCDESTYHGPMHCTMVVGDPIQVSSERVRGGGDPAMEETASSLQSMLDELVAERRSKLFGE